jgi:DMSO/TMAO reductase YedYZ molybdopterin-dependent catalytic subunit
VPLPKDGDVITEVGDLFVYHIFGYPDELKMWQRDPSGYSLEIRGRVEAPQSLSIEEIQRRFKPVSAEVVLQCMTNVHWGRVRVRGAVLFDVLSHVGIKPGALKVGFRGAEGFTTDLFVDEVRRDSGKFLLVYEMNGEPLTREHGYPLRVVADGKYAYKWCKWLTTIEVVDHDFKGHYEGNRGWSDAALRGCPVC